MKLTYLNTLYQWISIEDFSVTGECRECRQCVGMVADGSDTELCTYG